MSQPDITTKRILIVDDVASMRDMTKAVLREAGFAQVATVNDGAQALAILKKTRIDLVICDWNMPNMTGLELVKAMKESDVAALRDMPILMLTGSGEKEKVVDVIRLGISGYIVKPYQQSMLIEKVRAALTLT